ncbi:hypothetical protein VCCP10303_1817, partial [Vibrio cholerae CP1030(3)]
MTLLLP